MWCSDIPGNRHIPKLPRWARTTLLTTHIMAASAWMGGLAASIASEHIPHADAQTISDLDLTIVMALLLPACAAAVTSGVMLAALSPWGLFRYRWLIVKELIATALLTTATIFAVFHIKSTETKEIALGALIVVTAMSVSKPWGRTEDPSPRIKLKQQPRQAP